MINRRDFLGLIGLLATGSLLGCCGGYNPNQNIFTPSSKEYVRDFLKRHNLIQKKDKDTIYAVLEFGRQYFKHYRNTSWPKYLIETTDENGVNWNRRIKNYPIETSVKDLLNHADLGYSIPIGGCSGSADLIKHMLSSVDIVVKPHYIKLGDQRGHAGIYFPSIDKTTLHADNIHSNRMSIRKREVPTSSLLYDYTTFEVLNGHKDMSKIERKNRFDNLLKYHPDCDFYKIGYGVFNDFLESKGDEIFKIISTDMGKDCKNLDDIKNYYEKYLIRFPAKDYCITC